MNAKIYPGQFKVFFPWPWTAVRTVGRNYPVRPLFQFPKTCEATYCLQEQLFHVASWDFRYLLLSICGAKSAQPRTGPSDGPGWQQNASREPVGPNSWGRGLSPVVGSQNCLLGRGGREIGRDPILCQENCCLLRANKA